MDGLITAFFKPLVKRTIIDVDGPCIIASTSASVHDTSPRPSRPSTAPPHAVESVPLVHVCQREPIEEKFTSRYLHSPPPRPVTTPTGGVGDLCDWREVPPTVQPLQGHCTPNSLLPRYQERTPPLTSDLTLSIRVTKRRRKIAVDKTAYPQHSTNLHSDLWVHTYRPLTCDEVCGNAESCSYLYQWLTNHVQCCRDDYEEDPTNALLLYGPPGSGKTAAVYAVASQLGIRVHEVNCSSLRDKGNLLSVLKEATLSHQVVGISIATSSVILIEETEDSGPLLKIYCTQPKDPSF